MEMIKTGLRDFMESLNRLPLAFYFAWGDTKARYRRSVLGPFWLVLGTGIGVAGLGFLWSALFKMDRASFIPSLTVGLVVWQFIAGCVTESSTVFIRNTAVIRNLQTPYFIFPFQLLLRQLINFGHNLIVVFIVLIIFPPPLSYVQFLVIPGIFLLVGNLLWIAMMIAMLGSRFRDLEQLIGAFMPMLFFLSPVIYRPSQLGIKEHIAWFNPFSYMISLIRDPIQGFAPPSFVYLVSFGMLVIGWFVTLLLLSHKRGRIAFWV
jgi:ABC-type polysaccharide/polyol phosphate export permease